MLTTRRAAVAALAAAPLLRDIPAAGQSAAPPDFHRFSVGALRVTVVTDGFGLRPDVTRGLVVNATPEQVAAALQAGGVAGPAMRNPYNITFVETARGLVAIDAGTGAVGGQAGALQANMRKAGLDPAQVVLVIHTHFHGDHIGGLATNEGTALFPQAMIAVPEREWTFWTDAGEESRAAENRRPNFALVRRRFEPYGQKITRFQPGAEVAPGIHAVASPGHSPGHCSFLVADGSRQALVLGDAVTTPVFFMANPDWYPVFDMDPPLAVETRKRLLDRAATEGMPVIGYHFDMPATGRVERVGSAYRLVPAEA